MNELSYKLFFKAISNKTRFEIVTRLGLEQSRVSHNLKCLVDCGFVNGRYKGKSRIYSLTPEVVDILNAINRHLDKYHAHLKSCGALEKHDAPRSLGR
ncbi:helix-turn-helix transcriptional regulator [Candidatus Woesearchaeota archaeon]|nr:helix-turn-helix transcriptional regulator [Candidatus Woesearchaeota archaeon]